MTDWTDDLKATAPVETTDRTGTGGNGGNGGNSADNAEESCSQPHGSAVGTGGIGLPPRFFLRDGGLWYSEPSAGGRPIWICSELRVTALTRNEHGEAWGRLLEFEDADGQTHVWACPMELLAGDGIDFFRHLMSKGLAIAPSSKARGLLRNYVQAARVSVRVTCTTRTGWHGPVYVLPDETIGRTGGERLLLQTLNDPPGLAQAGTAADWRDSVGLACIGNSRLIFAVSMGFAAPLLHLVVTGSGGVNLVGASSTGKTTALRVAGSVWGPPDPLRTWRGTANGLEGVAVLHNDRLLILDELGEIDPREAGSAAYMLANGAGKARARRDGLARPAAKWQLLFLSSGEVGLADHMREARKRTRAGHEVRLVDLPADAGAAGHGMFEQIHGQSNGAEFAGMLLSAIRQAHGAVGRAYLRRLVEEDPDEVRQSINAMRFDFAEEVLPSSPDGQARRVADRFALIAAGGALATRFGLTGWPENEATNAAKTCFQTWLDRRGGAGSAEAREALAVVDHFIEKHGASRFSPLGASGENEPRPIFNRAGHIRRVDGRRQYLFLPEVFRKDVCAGIDYRRVLDALEACGRLEKGDGKHRGLRVRDIEGASRVYAIWEAVDED